MDKKFGWLLAAAASISITAFGHDNADEVGADNERDEVVINLEEIVDDAQDSE